MAQPSSATAAAVGEPGLDPEVASDLVPTQAGTATSTTPREGGAAMGAAQPPVFSSRGEPSYCMVRTAIRAGLP